MFLGSVRIAQAPRHSGNSQQPCHCWNYFWYPLDSCGTSEWLSTAWYGLVVKCHQRLWWLKPSHTNSIPQCLPPSPTKFCQIISVSFSLFQILSNKIKQNISKLFRTAYDCLCSRMFLAFLNISWIMLEYVGFIWYQPDSEWERSSTEFKFLQITWFSNLQWLQQPRRLAQSGAP